MDYLNIWYCITYKGQQSGGVSSLEDIQCSAGLVPDNLLVLGNHLVQHSACSLFQLKLLCGLRIVLFLCAASNTGQILNRTNT